MEFLIGVFVGGLMVGGVVFAKVMANKAEASAAPSTYLTGKGRVPVEPITIDPYDQDGHQV